MVDAGVPSELVVPPNVPIARAWLKMECGQTACRVSARYLLVSPYEQNVSLSFVLPGRVAMTATLDGQPLPHKVLADVPHNELEQTQYFSNDGTPPVDRAYVWAPLRAGGNMLEVRYWQKLGAVEVDWGWFHDGEMISRFKRILAPLRGNNLGAAFALVLDLSYDRGYTPRHWQRWNGKVKSLSCSDPFRTSVAISSEKGRIAHVRMKLNKAQLPDELTCRIGLREYVDPGASSIIPF